LKFCNLIFACLYILSIWSYVYTAQADDGKLVMTIQKYQNNLDGFRASVGMRGKEKQGKAWWETVTYNIYTLNPDGTSLTQLTEDDMSMCPKWSPDGRLIVYVSGAGSSKNLCVMNEDGSEKRELLSKQIKINDFWWSPDSSALLVSVETKVREKPEGYVAYADGKKKKRFGHPKWTKGWNHWDAHQAKIINPHPRLLSALPNVSWPKWSPDNRYIAFITERVLAIATVEPVSATGKWFMQQNEPPCNKIEEWSDDGSKILFYANGYICSAEVEKDKLTNMTNLSMFRGWDATWNGDGTRIAFVSRQPGRSNSDVYVMDADGSNQVCITYTNYNHMHLDWR